MKPWLWVYDKLGGFGIFMFIVFIIPLSIYINVAAIWTRSDRVICTVMLIIIGIVMGRRYRERDRRRTQMIERVKQLRDDGYITEDDADKLISDMWRAD